MLSFSFLFKCFAAVVTFICFTATPLVFAQSQANTGTIEGIVTDPAGQVLVNASVTLTNSGTSLSRTLSTDSDGRFRGLLLPLGAYKVTVQAQGSGHSS